MRKIYVYTDDYRKSPPKQPSRRNLSIREPKPRQITETNERHPVSSSKLQPEEKRKYCLGVGNNSDLVRRVMSHRSNWTEISDSKYIFINFRWQQSERGYKYENCIDNKVLKQALNHLQYHSELSNKEMLLKNLTDYCEINKKNVFDYTPVTFVLNMKDSNVQSNLFNFLKFFEVNMPAQLKAENRKLWIGLKNRRNGSYVPDKRSNLFYSKPIAQDIYFSKKSSYLWLLKPTFLNRGRGIHVFNELTSLENLMNAYTSGKDPQEKLNSTTKPNETLKNTIPIKATSFIVQKYLQRPMLISGRKFDIRVWVLFSHQAKVYLFKEGYLRTASQQFDVSQKSLQNQYIHLTNNAVQKYSKAYSKHQAGNQLSFQYLKQLLAKYNFSFDEVMTNMKQIVKMTALSVKKKINRLDRLFCFEIFGYDFMLDENGKLWLIEVNTNPCIEQSSPLLEQLLPRMLDDAFKLTIDQIYPRQHEEKNSRYVLPFYENNINLWEEVVDLKKR